jgi:transketolase
MNNLSLARISNQIKLSVLELACLKGKGHLGGTFSCLDLLVSLYYGGVLTINPTEPKWQNRDRFILSKGHACLGLYIILEDLGFITKNQLFTYGENAGLGAQLDIATPGVDWNTGSLGHALGVIAGIALASKIDGRDFYAYTILGDAEMSEGSVWEAIAFAGDKNISNLVCVIDRNKLSVTEVLENDGIFRNFKSTLNNLGWDTLEINGHDFSDILSAFKQAKENKNPTMILANTIKGKGVSFMENSLKWHHGIPTIEELDIARKELGLQING